MNHSGSYDRRRDNRERTHPYHSSGSRSSEKRRCYDRRESIDNKRDRDKERERDDKREKTFVKDNLKEHTPNTNLNEDLIEVPQIDLFVDEEERKIEEKRRKTEEILSRFKKNSDQPASPFSTTIATPTKILLEKSVSGNETSKIQSEHDDSSESNNFLTKKKIDRSSCEIEVEENSFINSSDYDPNMDEVADEEKRRLRLNEVLVENKKKNNKKEEDFDMFDMFNVEEKNEKEDVELESSTKQRQNDALILERAPVVRTFGSNLADNWDDEEGYYSIVLGEILNDRYHVYSKLGKGVFSSVVRAKDTKNNNKDVAIKIIRNNETMYKAGLKELSILKKLSFTDPDNKKHVIKFETNFEHKSHLCLVFESLHLNLREVLKKFGNNVGLNISAVKSYATQLLMALSLLKKCSVLHADIKPDNILVNESLLVVKLCDLGSASDISENEITPYLVSRFYRAPEIILGNSYDYSLDMWSIGCTLYELYTGKILFPGKSNNQMLKLQMDLKGKFSNKLLRKGKFTFNHFDDQFNFLQVDQDKISGSVNCKTVNIPAKPVIDLKKKLIKFQPKDAEELKLHLHFIDLLEKMLILNPEKRLTISDAFSHPFVTNKKL
ncbi:U4/U6 small nuclear ribonucleoprotein prp4 [Clydaea vesicula]|uniref:Serine/threonine-protein kinase PRP4 homolog n=1 Tax=Clydaea vesicula TaxID=447962 RepID=A0AAD5U0G1_9FUNG|nr:U4/U6 small nuclear ribonucleoprotein prp4 [Clydaea vesicula]KAJ3386441.1 U4/U6 small nuclear ribonucleoprotein prp4 [Lobulomyces angularis]